MLWVLKTDDWQNIKPFHFYLQALQDNLNKVVEELIQMRKAGVLRARYSMPLNETMRDLIFAMVESDKTVQWLMGDKQKQD